MYLTISKRFEISSSARLYRADWDEPRNRAVYGPACQGKYGHGYNYIIYFIFNGPVDEKTGMMLNVTFIKERVQALLAERYDHKFFNLDTPPYNDIVPTPENLALRLLEEVKPLFEDQQANPVACHLHDSLDSSTTAFADGRVERELWYDFSAARRTCSPHLSDEENHQLFGIASQLSGHGHNYRMKITLAGDVDSASGVLVPYETWHRAIGDVRTELDHKNLNTDVPGLNGLPITTESLARYICRKLQADLPVDRVKLFELRNFFSEYLSEGRTLLGIEDSFHAAHRLHSPHLTDKENFEVYGKCNNPNGHGHQYRVEATVGGPYDERTGTLYDFVVMTDAIKSAIEPWNYKHLGLETDDFAERPTTGENIVSCLWPRLDNKLDNRLHRLRLWETPNNRFALRRKTRN